jgi:hypothetical protein
MVRTKKRTVKPQSITEQLHHYIGKLNNSKLFAGIIMILLNIGSKLIPIQIGGTAEEYMKQTLSKHLLVFAMAWMGTRDIYTSLALTGLFILLSEYIFNDHSMWCVIPSQYKKTNNEPINNRINQPEKLRVEDITQVINSLENLKNKL